MNVRPLAWWPVAGISIVVLSSAPGWAEEREHFQLRLGAVYEQGDFGTPNTTTAVIVPLTLKYLGERFDLGVTTAFVYLETVGRVPLIEGTPTPSDQQGEAGQPGGGRTSASGLGDTLVKGRFLLLKDPGPESAVPALIPFAKVKLPTADADKNLGTGEIDYGFGLQWAKRFGAFSLFGDGSYTVVGSPPGQHFRNRPGASLGGAVDLSRAVTVSALVEWRRALVSTRRDPVALVGILTHRVTRAISVSPSVFVGLTKGSPDFGAGVELVYTFGRY